MGEILLPAQPLYYIQIEEERIHGGGAGLAIAIAMKIDCSRPVGSYQRVKCMLIAVKA